MSLSLVPSLGLVILLGMVGGTLVKGIRMPPLVGYLLAGILLGQSHLLGESLLDISSGLRQIALMMILLKAGLTLQWSRLKTVGKPALLMAFLPASFEIASCLVFAPLFFNITLLEAGVLGAVLAAVSPAVVVPRMVAYLERGEGSDSKAPEIVLAGASLDDVFVIVLFTSLVSLATGEGLTLATVLHLPLSFLTSLLLGGLLGKSLGKWKGFTKGSVEEKILLLLGIAFLLLALEEWIPFSALLCVMVFALCLEQDPLLSASLTSLWKGAELLLFVLVGVILPVDAVGGIGVMGMVLLFLGLFFRCVGVYFASLGGRMERNQRIFLMMSYLPKATVQAGIGGIPLAMGLDCGELVLTMAVLSIFATAPLGAWLIDQFGSMLLSPSGKEK